MLSPIHSCPLSIILTYTQPLLSPLHLIKISFPHSETCLSRPSPSLNVCLRVALSPSSFSCSSLSMAITIISFLVAPRVHHLCCPYSALHFYSLRSPVQPPSPRPAAASFLPRELAICAAPFLVKTCSCSTSLLAHENTTYFVLQVAVLLLFLGSVEVTSVLSTPLFFSSSFG